MNPAVERLGHLRIDLAAKTGEAAERRLDVAAGAAETVVEIEVAKRGIEIVEPHQAHYAAAEPNTFGVSGRAVDGLRGFDEFVCLALIVLGRIGGLRRIGGSRFLVGVSVAALRGRAANADQQGKSGKGEVTQNRILKLKHPSTHRFPDLLPIRARSGRF